MRAAIFEFAPLNLNNIYLRIYRKYFKDLITIAVIALKKE